MKKTLKELFGKNKPSSVPHSTHKKIEEKQNGFVDNNEFKKEEKEREKELDREKEKIGQKEKERERERDKEEKEERLDSSREKSSRKHGGNGGSGGGLESQLDHQHQTSNNHSNNNFSNKQPIDLFASTDIITDNYNSSADSDDDVFDDELESLSFVEVTDTLNLNSQVGLAKNSSNTIFWKKGSILGQGSFGKVYVCLNQLNGEFLAVKQIAIDECDDVNTKEVEGLQREMQILKRYRHEHIVQYYGTTRDKHNLNIFLEYVPGGSIHSLLMKFGPFSEGVVSVYIRQILLGLQYLHSKHIIHRDIKGANILVSQTGNIKLADFGAAKILEDLRGGSAEKSLKGTVYFMAPEVILQKGYGRQADIWSVGCTMIEMLTGRPPWAEFPDHVAAMYHIASTSSLPEFPQHLSQTAQDFLKLCLKRDPKKRANATQLLEHPFVAVKPALKLTETGINSRPKSFSYYNKSTSTNSTYEQPRKARSLQQVNNSDLTKSGPQKRELQMKRPQKPVLDTQANPTNPFHFLRSPPPSTRDNLERRPT